MATFKWHITEGFQVSLASGVGGEAGLYTVTVEDFDIAIANLPFLLYSGADGPYERITAQWQKEQFDNDRNVGEQSLTGWWLRSQANFGGGTGITYFEPLLGVGSETRFRDSRGVSVFTDNSEVTLLPATAEIVDLGASSVEVVAGPNRLLARDGGDLSVWNGTTESAVTGTTSANSLAYTGSLFLVGDNTNIYTLAEDTGTALSSIWNTAPGAVSVWWAKQRIFAAIGPALYELTLAGGNLSLETPLYTHPDDDWQWTSVTETGGAVWAAGYAGERSAVHVIVIDETGATPALTGATVGIQLPEGEVVNVVRGYLDFLLVGTSAGFRVAITDADRAGLGPLIFRDEAVLSLTARGDFAWCGLASGVTRKVDLGNEAAGDLAFAYANDLEGVGDVQSLTFYQGRLALAGASQGVYYESDTDLVTSGSLVTGYTRFGTLEGKHYETVRISADVSNGSLGILRQADASDATSVATLSAFNGSRNVAMHLTAPAERLSLTFTLNRDGTDPTLGPTFRSYQIRALPAPSRRQRLIRLPLMCFDQERDRWGNTMGGPGFAWARLRELERLESDGTPVIFQDFRTGESRFVVIDQIHFVAPVPPDRGELNYEGSLAVTIRTLD